MKTIELTCSYCLKKFPKILKEYNRQIKRNPNHRFYCNLRCSGLNNYENLDGAIRSPLSGLQKNEYSPFSEYLRRCKRRRHDCDLTLREIKEVWDDQNGRCAISNIPIFLMGEASSHIEQASLDRIKSELPYTKTNIQFVSCSINLAKNTLSDEKVHDLMKLICEHYVVDKRNSLS